jgi:ammonia channel protein AmtB
LGAIIVGVTAALTNTWLVPKIKFLKLKNTSRVGGLTESFIVAGLLGGLFSAIFAFFVSMQTFQDFNPDLFNGNSLKQVGIQLAGVGISTVMSIINGLISGLLLWIMTKKCGYDRSSEEENYQMVCSERPNDVSV